MTYSVSNKTPYQQPLTGLSDTQLQNIDTEKINRGISNSPVVKVADQKNPWLTIGVMLPTWLAVYVGMNKFGQICRGNYDETALGKMDKLNDKINKSKFIDNGAVNGLKKGFNSTKTFFLDKVVERSAILKSMLRTPSVPENKMVHTMAGGIKAEIASSASQLFDEYTNKGTDLNRIKELGFVDKSGKIDMAKYQDVVKNPHNYTTEIMDICTKQGQKQGYKIERGGKIPLSKHFTSNKQPKYLTDVMPFTKKIFCKTVYFSEYANKLKAVQKPGVAKSVLKVIEGFTNAGSGAIGAGGAVFASVMGAWFIGDAIIRTIKAPKGNGEKRKTFAENMIYNLGFYLTMPLTVKIMHSFGGLQYIGMDKERVAAYRTKLEEFNKMAKEGQLDQASYKAGKQELKNMLKGDTRILKADGWSGKNIAKGTKNIIHWPLKKLSGMFMVGLETFHPLRVGKQPTSFWGKAWRGIKEGGYWSKQGLAYPVRLIAFMFVLTPFLTKYFAKGSHVIFGKPTKSVLDDEEAKPEAPKAGVPQPTPQKPITMKPINRNADLQNNPITQPTRENLLDKYKAENYASTPAPVTAKTIEKPQEPARTYTYIPSSEPVKVDKKDNEEYSPQVQAVLAKANKAEQIAGRFTH